MSLKNDMGGDLSTYGRVALARSIVDSLSNSRRTSGRGEENREGQEDNVVRVCGHGLLIAPFINE